jgi:hypothetical protein
VRREVEDASPARRLYEGNCIRDATYSAVSIPRQIREDHVDRMCTRGTSALSRGWVFHDVFYSSFFHLLRKIPRRMSDSKKTPTPKYLEGPIKPEMPVTACCSLAHATVTSPTGLNNAGFSLFNASSFTNPILPSVPIPG